MDLEKQTSIIPPSTNSGHEPSEVSLFDVEGIYSFGIRPFSNGSRLQLPPNRRLADDSFAPVPNRHHAPPLDQPTSAQSDFLTGDDMQFGRRPPTGL